MIPKSLNKLIKTLWKKKKCTKDMEAHVCNLQTKSLTFHGLKWLYLFTLLYFIYFIIISLHLQLKQARSEHFTWLHLLMIIVGSLIACGNLLSISWPLYGYWPMSSLQNISHTHFLQHVQESKVLLTWALPFYSSNQHFKDNVKKWQRCTRQPLIFLFSPTSLAVCEIVSICWHQGHSAGFIYCKE